MASLLPDELINEILLRVPAKSILRFRCVSKRWLALIDDSDFVKFHLNRSIETDCINLVVVDRRARRSYRVLSPTRMYLLDQDIKIQNPPFDLFYHSAVVGSCNGVVCLIKNRDALLFNPITREYKIVEFDNELEKGVRYYRFIKHKNPLNGDGVYGLGCDSDEYKLVQFISHRSFVPRDNYLTDDYQSKQNSKINVYSLNDSSCLTISDIPYYFANIDEWGTYLNGAIHWVVKRINTQYEKLIISFNIREKVIREFPLPDVVDKTSCVTLGVLGGQLCVFLNFYLEIWVMKSYGLSSSWYKLASMDRDVFSLVFQEENHTYSSKLPANFPSSPQSEYHLYSLLSGARVLCFSKSGEILLSCAQSLFLYNPKQNTSRHIMIPGVGEEYPVHKIITNVASYVSLNSGSYLPVEERGPIPNKRKSFGGA